MNRGNARVRGRGVAPAPQPVAPVRFTVLCKEFSQLGGTPFNGSETIIEAQQWLRSLERIFTGLDITNAQKRQLAAWQLHDSALDWWESVTANTVEADLTWEQFRYPLGYLNFVPIFPFFESILSFFSVSLFQGGFCGKMDARSREISALS